MNSPHSPFPWRKGATHCNPRARSFSTSIFSGEDLIAETVIYFDAKRAGIYPAFTADEARLVSMANAEAIVAATLRDRETGAAELLAALRELVADYEQRPGRSENHRVTAARAAIAKAEGRA